MCVAKGFSFDTHGREKSRSADFCRKEASMLYWAAVFLVISIIAAALGFGGIAGAAAGIAKILFGIFLVLFILFLIIGWRAGRAIM